MDELITRKQAARLLGLSEQTLRHWAAGKRKVGPPPQRVGSRSVRYRLADVEAYAVRNGTDDFALLDIKRRIDLFVRHASPQQLVQLGVALARFAPKEVL